MNSSATSKLPKCPVCGQPVAYARIHVLKPFPCPSCARQLMVPKTFGKRLRIFSTALAIAVAIAVTYRYSLFAPRTDAELRRAFAVLCLTYLVTLSAATVLGFIFVKRIFPPKLEDYEEYSKQAHYTAL